jgi:hypothetical protein
MIAGIPPKKAWFLRNLPQKFGLKRAPYGAGIGHFILLQIGGSYGAIIS